MEFEYKNKKYKVGQRFRFIYSGCWFVGEIVFDVYADSEGYSDFSHLGVLIKFNTVIRGNSYMTFPDFIDEIGEPRYYME
jgi:hypothetical protein